MDSREPIIDAAVEWWVKKCPLSMSITDFLKTPTVNCVTPAEKKLAKAVADWWNETDLENERLARRIEEQHERRRDLPEHEGE